MDGVSELEAVDASRHLDVGEQQLDIRAQLQNSKRVVGIDGFDGCEPGILDDIHRAHAQHHFVFDNKNVGWSGGDAWSHDCPGTFIWS